MGVRVGLNVADSGAIDVGYASVVGADRIAHGEPIYDNFPDDVSQGDTYGPVRRSRSSCPGRPSSCCGSRPWASASRTPSSCTPSPPTRARAAVTRRPRRRRRSPRSRATCPARRPTVPGHEVAAPDRRGRGDAVTRHRVGERVLVQTDYRHLPTAGANAAFGYNFEGGLQEYVAPRRADDHRARHGRALPDPRRRGALAAPRSRCSSRGPASRPRTRATSAARSSPADASWWSPTAGAIERGLDALLAAARPGIGDGRAPRTTAQVAARSRPPSAPAGCPSPGRGGTDELPPAVVRRHRLLRRRRGPDRGARDLLAPRGVIDIVLGGDRIGRPVAVDVGRIHYDLTRWVGTTGDVRRRRLRVDPRPTASCATGDRGRGHRRRGPDGLHARHPRRRRPASRGSRLAAIDIDDARLAHLADVAGPLAAERGVAASFLNSRDDARPEPGFSYVGVMVPAPRAGGPGGATSRARARASTCSPGSPSARARRSTSTRSSRGGVYLFGTSGSVIRDMKAVLGRLERGRPRHQHLGRRGDAAWRASRDALAAVEARTSGGKIVVYPQLHELGMVRLARAGGPPAGRRRALRDGRWTREAEEGSWRSRRARSGAMRVAPAPRPAATSGSPTSRRPSPGRARSLVRVTAVGICGSDLHWYDESGDRRGACSRGRSCWATRRPA